jgi:hypothetical protein
MTSATGVPSRSILREMPEIRDLGREPRKEIPGKDGQTGRFDPAENAGAGRGLKLH